MKGGLKGVLSWNGFGASSKPMYIQYIYILCTFTIIYKLGEAGIYE